MRVHCHKSGIIYEAQYFPGLVETKECQHPVFLIPQKHLFICTNRWAAGTLTDVDSYLLYLSLLDSTGLVEFRTPAKFTAVSKTVIAQNMEKLARTISYMNLVTTPRFSPMRVAISADNAELDSSKYWIESWMASYEDFKDGYTKAHERDELVRMQRVREYTLEKFIKNKEKDVEDYAKILAKWASVAGSFPTWYSGTGEEQVCISDYWQSIIVRGVKGEKLYEIPKKDIEELMEHCACYVEPGSIYSKKLHDTLVRIHEKVQNWGGFGDLDFNSSSPYKILDSEDSIENANMAALISQAPAEKPTPAQYPDRISYIRAKLKWDMAEQFRAQNTSQSEGDSSNE